jgi:hypothetical protein
MSVQLNQELRLFIFKHFPGFNYPIVAVKSRNFVLKRRTKFIAKFPGFKCKSPGFQGSDNAVKSRRRMSATTGRVLAAAATKNRCWSTVLALKRQSNRGLGADCGFIGLGERFQCYERFAIPMKMSFDRMRWGLPSGSIP